MHRIYSLLALFLVVAIPMAARNVAVIGYCDGEVAVSSSIGVNNGEDCIEAAAVFPASMFDSFEDGEIAGINVGLATRLNVADIKVWVRETLDGPDIFSSVVKKDEGISKGWNRIMGTSTPLPKGKDLYVGYSLSLSGASFPVSAVGKGRPGGLYFKTNGEWTDLSEEGVLSVEMLVSASNLNAFDLVLKQVSLPENIKIETTVPMDIKVFNAGVEKVAGFRVECLIDNCEPIVYAVDLEIEPNQYGDITLDFTSPVSEKNSEVVMKVNILGLDDQQDANPENNEMTTSFSSTRYDYNKLLLIEEFTTEQCTFCPRAAVVLHDLLQEPEYQGKIVAAAHHVGFYTDWLTIPASNNYLWFYNGNTGSTYAPAFMFDRYDFDGVSPVCNATMEYSEIKDRVSERLSTVSKTALEISALYDNDTSMLGIHVEGERREGYAGDRLTIYIVENEIPARKQNGSDGPFTHQHVVREVNDIWGDIIEWDDSNSFSVDKTIYINPQWVKENIEVIAFISDYHADNFKNCEIDNTAVATIDWNKNGVMAVGSGDADEMPEYYTLTGLRVDRPSSGIYVVKRGNSVSKEVVK